MDSRQRRENDRNVRSSNFLTENAADFASNAVATAKIAALQNKVAQTETELQKQIAGDGSVRQDYSVYKDNYDRMLDEMRGIRDFADSMAQDIPGLEKKFRIPKTGGKTAVIAAAYVFADEAEIYRQQFLDYGMDADFITDLRAGADAARQSAAAAKATTGSRVGATDTLEIEIRDANKIVETIDPIVRRTYRADPTKLAAWTFASHLERHTPIPRAAKPKNPNAV